MNKEFLINYLNTNSPSTNEVEAQKVWKDYLSDSVDEFISDNYGNVSGIIKSKSATDMNYSSPYKVVIEAHCDEIGWIVKRISDKGQIYVTSNGGVDYNIVIGSQVNIFTESGDIIKGFFGWPPIHLLSSAGNPTPTADNVFIEVGTTSKEEVEKLGIEIGNFILPNRKAEIMNDEFIISKALDDKLGGFIIAEVVKYIKENDIKLPYDLYVVNAVQEEVGLRGAKMMTETIKPNIAVCIDVTHDTSIPLLDANKVGDFKLGDGVVISQAPAIQRNMLKLMKKTATDNEIPFKIQVSSSMTGTNTDSYNLSNGGVICGLISLPLRYMHTPNEMAKLSDVEHAIKMYVELLKRIEYKHDFSVI